MSDDDPERNEGVNFSDVDAILEEVSYPIEAEELVERYGDRTIDRTNAEPITLEELFEPLIDDTLESKEGARQSILMMMPKDSEGRQRYSDRGLTIDDPDGYSRREDDSQSGQGGEDV